MRMLGLLLTISLISGACARQVLPQNGTGSFGQDFTPGTSVTTPTGSSAPSAPAPAMGTINGGGGVGIRCNGRLELLDLYEARAAGLTLVSSPATREAAIELVARIVSNHFWNIETIPREQHAEMLVKTVVAPFFDGKPFVNYGSQMFESVEFVDFLPLSNDLGTYTLPPGCSLEQIAYFSDTNTHVQIVKRAWAEIDWLSKAVLNTHELMYMIDRREGLENLRRTPGPRTSESTRRFVGHLFTNEALPSKMDHVPPKEKIVACRTTGGVEGEETYFYAFDREPDGALTMVFNQVIGRSSLYQMRADFLQDTSAALKVVDAKTTGKAEIKLSGSNKYPKLSVEIARTKDNAPTLIVRDWSEGAGRAIGEPRPFGCDTIR